MRHRIKSGKIGSFTPEKQKVEVEQLEDRVVADEVEEMLVDEDEEDMGRAEEGSAQGEPVVALRDEQYIAEPARDESQQQVVFGPALPSGRGHIEQDEEDEQEGFRFLTGRSIVFPAVREMDAGEDEKQDEEGVHGDRHRDPSFHIVINLFEQPHCTITEQIRSTVKKRSTSPKVSGC